VPKAAVAQVGCHVPTAVAVVGIVPVLEPKEMNLLC
jgi:hypothetical protein